MSEAKTLRGEAAKAEQAKAESIERSDTDGFASQAAHGLMAQLKTKQAEIVEAGGIATFGTYALIDAEGAPVEAKLLNGQYGPYWALFGEGEATFYSAHKGPKGKLAKAGLTETLTKFTAPAQAKIVGGGKGIAGMASCTIGVLPADPDVKYNTCHGVGDQTKGDA